MDCLGGWVLRMGSAQIANEGDTTNAPVAFASWIRTSALSRTSFALAVVIRSFGGVRRRWRNKQSARFLLHFPSRPRFLLSLLARGLAETSGERQRIVRV